MKISFADLATQPAGAVVLFATEDGGLTPAGMALDQRTGGHVGRALVSAKFTGKKGQSVTVVAPAGLSDVSHIIVLGAGKIVDDEALADLGGQAYVALVGSKAEEGMLVADVGDQGMAARLAYGVRLRAYRFDKYLTKQKPEDKSALKTVTMLADEHKATKKAFAPLQAIAEGVHLTRDLVSEPPNVLNPLSFVERVSSELQELGVEIDVLDKKRMRKLGMGALLGVAQGSENEPAIMIMRWTGANEDAAPLAVVGKGVTFDSGGLSLKPPGSMEDMKWDMGGAGVVAGLMKAIAGRKAAVNVVGAVGLVENMPDGNAQRPGDIVTSMSGQTIEVLNTDAEGRLVLADLLWYVKENFAPAKMVNLATLTGAIIVALGSEYAGLFSNDDNLADELVAAGKSVEEKLWRMPLHENYDKDINCDIADMRNIGTKGEAGSVTAAQFLQRFVGETKWAHLDIAGVTWSRKATATVPKGGTGFGVRLLNHWVAAHEGK
jgi:leucyl aminopeptidase